MAVGHDIQGSRKDGINGAVPGRNVQGGDAVGATIWKRELGGYWGDAQGTDDVPPSGDAMDHGDDGETRGRRRVGVVVSIVRGGNGLCGDPPHWGIHQNTADDHIGEGVLLARLCTVHGGGEDSGHDPDGALVGSRRGK